jgi:hypothetical protein
MNDTAVFGAPWDQRLFAITLLTSALMLGGAAFCAWLALSRPPAGGWRWALLAAAAVPLIAFVAGAILAPRGYSVRDGSLVIERFARPVVIPLAAIRGVEPIDDARLAGAWRVLGSGGFFGYYGRFRNSILGDFRMYATRGHGHVLVRADRSYVLTPDAPERFVAALRAGTGGGGPASGPGSGR